MRERLHEANCTCLGVTLRSAILLDFIPTSAAIISQGPSNCIVMSTSARAETLCIVPNGVAERKGERAGKILHTTISHMLVYLLF
jgi:hypothetical protein